VHLQILFIKKEKCINILFYKKIIPNFSEKTLYRDLQDLINRGLLKEVGEKKGRKNEIP